MTGSEGHVVVEPGIRLYYRVLGEGPDTVVIPAATWWSRQADRLARGRRVALYDPRGRGRSDSIADNVPVGFDAEVGDLEALRGALGIERMALMGWSYLGAVVVLYTIAHPDRVTRLVQVGPTVRLDTLPTLRR